MMKEAMHWMLLSGSVLDTVLLVRVLGLRLQRIYAFITLDCVLSVLFDWTAAYLGWDSPAALRVFVFSRFLYVVLTPLIVWDVFEEVKLETAKVRRLEAVRMIMSLVIMAVFFFVMLANVIFAAPSDATAGWPGALGFLLWGAACFTGMIFIWRTRRSVLKQEGALPRNTTVWSIYYMLTLASSVVDVGIAFSGSKAYEDAFNIIVSVWLIGCTIFCVLRLRGAPIPIENEGRE
jgi:hypothetical protein